MEDAIPQGQAGRFRTGHETTQIAVRGLVVFAAVLIGTIVVVLAALGLWMHEMARKEAPPLALSPGRRSIDAGEFPNPRLQEDPRTDLVRVEEEELTLIHSYGWVDPQVGIARIPVDRAMDILAQRGLPRVPAPPPVPGAPPHTSLPPARKRDEPGQGSHPQLPAKTDEPRPEAKRGEKP